MKKVENLKVSKSAEGRPINSNRRFEFIAHNSCDGCAAYLGGGCCRDNLEAECAGGEYEMWREQEEHDDR